MTIDQTLTWIEEKVIVVSYTALIGIVGLETIRRFVTRQQAAWGPEVAIFAFIWLSWFAVSRNIAEQKHLAFHAIRARLPLQVRLWLEQLDCLLWLTLSAIIVWGSIDVIAMNLRFDQVIFGTDIPLAVASAAVPVAWVLCSVRALQRWRAIVRGEDLSSTIPAVEELR